jgi:pyrethroid hydrolase
MDPNFEIKFLEIRWYDQDTPTQITESFLPLEVEYNRSIDAFECESTIYPNAEGVKNGQLAIRFLNKKSDKPYIENAEGGHVLLKSVLDKDTGREWWIEATSWDKQFKYWRHQSLRHAGSIKLLLQNKICFIRLGSMDFKADELEKYLQDFKNGLWEVILDEQSYVQTEIEQGSVASISTEVIQCFTNLISYVEKILQSPKAELREIQSLRPRKMVKPINRTFMELMTKSYQRLLTSRVSEATYDVAENRYVLFALNRCFLILKQLVFLSGNKSYRYLHNFERLKAQFDDMTSFIQVDRDLVVKDLKKLKRELDPDFWTKKIEQKISASGIRPNPNLRNATNLFFGIESKANGGGFFVKIRYSETDDWRVGNKENGWLFLDFSPELVDLGTCFDTKVEYEIVGEFHVKTFQNSIRHTIEKLASVKVSGGSLIREKHDQFNKERDQGIELNKNNWKRQLNRNESEEQEREKKALVNRMDFYLKHQKVAESVYLEILPKQKKMQNLIQRFNALGVVPSATFPNSMTFIQNPNYQGLHTLYKHIRNITNLADDHLLLSLEKIDNIGLINMPLLYERWCLIQLVKVLVEQFRFIPQKNWKQILVSMVLSKKTDLEIILINESAKREICLTYEKTLDNGKRPDFVLDLKWLKKQVPKNNSNNGNRDITPLTHTDIVSIARFVLDAKFYDKGTFDRLGGLGEVVKNLYVFKDYSEGQKNCVFILHPCKTALPEKSTPQKWGEHSYLGEVELFNWNAEKTDNPLHRYGAISFNPIDRQGYLDELQRLLGLCLQYNLESTDTGALQNDDVVSENICIRCGSTDIRLVPKGELRDYSHKSIWYECNECTHFTSYNHCKCGTRFIKNGFYWTYHAAKALDPFNNKCPNCESWGAW